ncbi:zinc-binding dehydrogenase [Spirillospora sp. CA-255316]
MGGDYGTRSVRTLRPGGVIVCITPRDVRIQDAPGVRTEVLLVEPDQQGLKELAALAEAGRLRAELDTVVPLEEAAKAHERGETNRTAGKIVLTVVR